MVLNKARFNYYTSANLGLPFHFYNLNIIDFEKKLIKKSCNTSLDWYEKLYAKCHSLSYHPQECYMQYMSYVPKSTLHKKF